MQLREIGDVLHFGCIIPPSSGARVVDPRVLSLYSIFNISPPKPDDVKAIYRIILDERLASFTKEVQQEIEKVTDATQSLFTELKNKLPRTPRKFHYLFDLRDCQRIYQGLYLSTPLKIRTKSAFVRLWRNECLRVIADRLIDPDDIKLVETELIPSVVDHYFRDVAQRANADPVLFGDFMQFDSDEAEKECIRNYEDLGTYDAVRKKLGRILDSYNENNQKMNLILFNDALEHVVRIHRIIRFPKGSALLVGVGGSGK